MNKRLLILSAALVLAASARSAEVAPGIYTGTGTDLLAASGNGPYTAQVSQVMGQHRARFICQNPGENCYEDWVWDDARLTVTRHTILPGSQRPDGRMHQELDVLMASKAGGSYQVLPSDPASGYCGLGLHPGAYLTIALTADGFTCETWDPRGMAPPTQAALLRTLAFKRLR